MQEKEIEALLQEAIKLNGEWERIEAIRFPAVRRAMRRHFRPRLRRFLISVQAAQQIIEERMPL